MFLCRNIVSNRYPRLFVHNGCSCRVWKRRTERAITDQRVAQFGDPVHTTDPPFESPRPAFSLELSRADSLEPWRRALAIGVRDMSWLEDWSSRVSVMTVVVDEARKPSRYLCLCKVLATLTCLCLT